MRASNASLRAITSSERSCLEGSSGHKHVYSFLTPGNGITGRFPSCTGSLPTTNATRSPKRPTPFPCKPATLPAPPLRQAWNPSNRPVSMQWNRPLLQSRCHSASLCGPTRDSCRKTSLSPSVCCSGSYSACAKPPARPKVCLEMRIRPNSLAPNWEARGTVKEFLGTPENFAWVWFFQE
jgi:hypothetical protein